MKRHDHDRDDGALACRFCRATVPHYEGGTVSDTDDVVQVTLASLAPRGSIVRAPGYRLPYTTRAPIARSLVRYAHGPCWREAMDAGNTRWVVVMSIGPDPVES